MNPSIKDGHISQKKVKIDLKGRFAILLADQIWHCVTGIAANHPSCYLFESGVIYIG